jgi:hypothetical protein
MRKGEQMNIGDFRLVQTCTACPEQYDVYCDEEVVGYLRLRHGGFTARLFGPGGPLVYQAEPIGDGVFESNERDHYLRQAVNAIQRALEQGPPEPIADMDDMQPIRGGFHIKTLPDGHCIDVLEQLYNWRIVLGTPEHRVYEHGWCYFGFGEDSEGRPRTKATSFSAAMTAALAWNGRGTPPGYDKEAF